MCSCCDPTHDSPDPVVVRLEREIAELNYKWDSEAFWRAALQAELDAIRQTINTISPLTLGPLPHRVLQLCNDMEVARKELKESHRLLLEACAGLDGARFAAWLQEVLALIGITPDEHARMCGDLVRKRTEGS